MKANPEDLVLVGYTLKPFGLFGEMKVRPVSFDQNRHASLGTVYFKKRPDSEPETLEIRGSRADAEFWYLKFKDWKTPEATAHLSGGMLFIPEEERLELPEDMVYFSDVPGMQVVDSEGKSIGTVTHVLEGTQDMLAVKVGSKEVLIPWNDHFVKSIDKVARIVMVEISGLESLL